MDGDDIYVHYTGSQADNGEQRETRVHLVCLKDATSDSEPVITTAGDDVNSLHYVSVFKSNIKPVCMPDDMFDEHDFVMGYS